MIVQVLTDKVNRSVALVREVVKDCGGKMADSGSIMFKFKRARVVSIKAADADKDQLLSIALDAGADDVIEPSTDEDDSEEDSERYTGKINTWNLRFFFFFFFFFSGSCSILYPCSWFYFLCLGSTKSET